MLTDQQQTVRENDQSRPYVAPCIFVAMDPQCRDDIRQSIGTTQERRKLGESADDPENLGPRCIENLKRPALNDPVKEQNASSMFCNQLCVLLSQRSMAASSFERESTHRSPEPKHSFFQNGAFDLR